MEETLIITSSKETVHNDGIIVTDISTGSSIGAGFKNCVCNSGGNLL